MNLVQSRRKVVNWQLFLYPIIDTAEGKPTSTATPINVSWYQQYTIPPQPAFHEGVTDVMQTLILH